MPIFFYQNPPRDDVHILINFHLIKKKKKSSIHFFLYFCNTFFLHFQNFTHKITIFQPNLDFSKKFSLSVSDSCWGITEY